MLNGLVGRARGRCALAIALLSLAVLVSAAPASAGIEGTYSEEGHGHLVVAHTDSGPAITEFFANFGRCSYSLGGGDVPIHDGRAVFIAQSPFLGRWAI